MNRLRIAQGYNNIDINPLSTAFNTWGSGSTYANRYHNEFTFDANGNIETQKRFSDAGVQIEDMTYKYNVQGGLTIQNRLYHAQDAIASTAFTDDIDDMGTFDGTLANINALNNYKYDEEGRLVQDLQEEIADIEWRVDGKVAAIYRILTSTKKNLKFDYDAMGNRIAKHIYDVSGVWEKSTYYVRDAQGNVMAVYDKKVDPTLFTSSYKVIERDIYGSSRLGMNTTEVELVSALPISAIAFQHELGLKNYELSNHLGNVLSVVSDRKRPVDDGDYDFDNDGENDLNDPIALSIADGVVDYYTSEIISATDYTPFGIEQNGRNFSSSSFRYGFSGMEKDNEVKGSGNSYDFGARLYDSRLGRWLTIDAHQKAYPGISPNSFSFNNPIIFNDPSGKDGRLTIDKGKSTVTLETTVHLYGATSKEEGKQIAAEANASFKKFKNTQRVKDSDGKVWKVKINVKYVYDEVLDSKGEVMQNDIPEGDNVISLSGTMSGGEGRNSAEGDATQGGWKGGVRVKNSTVLIHETFHELGYDEAYQTADALVNGEMITVSADKDHLIGDVLSTGASPVTKISGFHFVDLLDFALGNYGSDPSGCYIVGNQTTADEIKEISTKIPDKTDAYGQPIYKTEDVVVKKGYNKEHKIDNSDKGRKTPTAQDVKTKEKRIVTK